MRFLLSFHTVFSLADFFFSSFFFHRRLFDSQFFYPGLRRMFIFPFFVVRVSWIHGMEMMEKAFFFSF